MQKQSLVSLTVILMLFLSACTKEDVQNPISPNSGQSYSQDPYVLSYSNWTTDASLAWSDGTMTEPSRESFLDAPELTQEMIDAGSFVLVYAKSIIGGSEQIMPAEFYDVNNSETNVYGAHHVIGGIKVSHTRLVNGAYQVPNDLNEISFRYIIVKLSAPDPNARQLTINDFMYMPYKDVVSLLSIPE